MNIGMHSYFWCSYFRIKYIGYIWKLQLEEKHCKNKKSCHVLRFNTYLVCLNETLNLKSSSQFPLWIASSLVVQRPLTSHIFNDFLLERWLYFRLPAENLIKVLEIKKIIVQTFISLYTQICKIRVSWQWINYN